MKQNNLNIGKVISVDENKIEIKFIKSANNENIIFDGIVYNLVGYNNLYKVKHDDYYIVLKVTSDIRFLNEDNNNLIPFQEKKTYCIPIGILKGGKFEMGSFYIPSVFDDIYLLLQEDFKNISRSLLDDKFYFNLGNITYGYNKGYSFGIDFNEFSKKILLYLELRVVESLTL